MSGRTTAEIMADLRAHLSGLASVCDAHSGIPGLAYTLLYNRADEIETRFRDLEAKLTEAIGFWEQHRAITAPLHDVWLQAKPPCPTCDGTGGVFIEHDNGGEYARNEWDQEVCPDCTDGVLPFDKWTAELVALWTAVHGSRFPVWMSVSGGDIDLRQIGGTR